MPHQNAAIGELLKSSAILPVVTLTDLTLAIPLAKALYDGGCQTLEITLRTPVALAAIRLIADEIPNMIVGAGSVNNVQHFNAAFLHKAAFAVSPGFTKSLLSIANEIPLPYLPGVATPSECMQLQEYGYNYLK